MSTTARTQRARRLAGFTAVLFMFVAGVIGARQFEKQFDSAPVARVSTSGWTNGTDTVPELVVVLVASVTCAACNDPALPGILQKIREQLLEEARRGGERFAMIGVAVSEDVARGASYLSEVATFDEIMVGNQWLNQGIDKYVVNDHPGPRATPQVLAIRRRVTRYGVVPGSERLLIRKLGLNDFRRWSDSGAPLVLADTAATDNRP